MTQESASTPLDIAQFRDVFCEEAAEHLDAMEALLVGIDVGAPPADDLNAIFRSAHSLKGGSAMFGFDDMTQLTHELESLLDRVRKGELALVRAMVDELLASSDLLRAQLAHYSGHGEPPQIATSTMCARIRACISEAAGPAAASDAKDAAAASRGVEFAFPATADVVALLPDLKSQLCALGTFEDRSIAGECIDVAGEPVPLQRWRLATGESSDVILTLFEFVMDSARVEVREVAPAAPAATAAVAPPPQPAVAPAPTAIVAEVHDTPKPAQDKPRAADGGDKAETSIRVSVEKVDQLINQVGELVITQAMLAQSVARLDPLDNEKLLAGMADLERNTRDLQESVMSIRMLPIAFVFNRFPRLVRDLAAKLGKDVSLATFGESTELDKGLIEKIADPLTHLVRNSIDHGIETPQVRVAAGKPARGTVTLRAAHQGGNILIEVSDDGAGLDRDRILAKARERGMAVSEAMSDGEVWGLIFEAGFSTATVVTDVSGRGVGMDVVKRNIGSLRGSVEIESSRGHGTKVTVRLPLTLAIMDGMSVAVGPETYILPLAGIVESLQVAEADVRSIAGQGRVIDVRSDFLPVVSLPELLGIEPRAHGAPGTMVIVEAEGGKAALLVDELLGQHQVVVKSLDANYHRVEGVSGATIMGDGRVALILDVAALTREHRNGRGAQLQGAQLQ